MHAHLKLLLVTALILPACGLLTPAATPAAPSLPALTLAALSNCEYRSPDWGTYRLTDGLYERPPQNPGEASSAHTTRLLEPAAFGDLNSDGVPDAVVGLSTQNGGTGHFIELAVVLNRAGQPENVATASLGDRVVIESAGIDAGIITLHMRVHGPNDGLCCPSQSEIWQYQLQADGLVRLAPPASIGARTNQH